MGLTAVATVYGRLSRRPCGVLGGLILAEIERLCAEGDGATLKDIHACLGSAHSTIFRNVEALVEVGLVTGVAARPAGQRYGKPRNMYRLTPEGFTELRAAEQFALDDIG